ncbi:MarR family winged helix-turn-helix transcriptional regulator [Pseudonocardia sp. ICBG1293]|uniref:MarR family winged helix-turn-helix transcriptional regulator n=1 Tax=Pseudonocardia sp. ICBG1293 TaxID=2844382 RepID=UPI001CCFAB78|nr:MarR family transcriptional regulator [Pseudonocardia sp. ICBG1293]
MRDEPTRDETIRALPGLADLDDVSLAVSGLISASQDLVVRTARTMGIGVTDMTAIMVLTEHGPMGATGLAGRLGITLASTTVLADRLERAGYVARGRDAEDRRRVTLAATAAARGAAGAAWLPAITEIDDVCRVLSGPQRESALDLLARLTAAVQQGNRNGPAAARPGGHAVGTAGSAGMPASPSPGPAPAPPDASTGAGGW